MAAAEYYNGGGGLRPPLPQQFPSNQPNASPAPSNPPYPLSDQPPPYTAYAESIRPQSQPPPQRWPSQGGGGGQYHPGPPPGAPPYPPEKNNLPNGYQIDDYGRQYPQHPQQSQQNLVPPPGAQPMRRRYTSSPYRDRSRSRSRSRARSRNGGGRPQMHRKKSSGFNTFLGAGGGAIIGDAIFPGLGTLGGALLGGFGGHEYGKRRSHPGSGRDRGYSHSGEYYYSDDDHRRGRKH